MNPNFCNTCDLVGGYCGNCDGSHWVYFNALRGIKAAYKAKSLTAKMLIDALPSLGFVKKDDKFFVREITHRGAKANVACTPNEAGQRFHAGIHYPAGNGFGGGVGNGDVYDAWYCIEPYV